MSDKRKSLPPYLQRSLLALVILLLAVSVARLLTSMHQQQERIEVLEEQVAQLMADTARLQIPAYRPSYAQGSSQARGFLQRPDYTSRATGRGSNSVSQQASPASQASPDFQASPAPQASQASPVPSSSSSGKPAETASHKFTEPRLFDLNTIDSLTLVRIPGIAAKTASVILKYRQRYGGFYDPHQLQDFLTWDAAQAYMDEWCTHWFRADASRLRHIPLNTATVAELQRHPYISHDQAISLLQYRSRHKRISAPEELQQFPTFSAEQIQALLPYLSFD